MDHTRINSDKEITLLRIWKLIARHIETARSDNRDNFIFNLPK